MYIDENAQDNPHFVHQKVKNPLRSFIIVSDLVSYTDAIIITTMQQVFCTHSPNSKSYSVIINKPILCHISQITNTNILQTPLNWKNNNKNIIVISIQVYSNHENCAKDQNAMLPIYTKIMCNKHFQIENVIKMYIWTKQIMWWCDIQTK